MKLENVRVEFSTEVTVNTGNFTNVRPGYRLSADLPKDATLDEVRDFLKEKVETWLEEDIDEIRAETNL